MAAKAAPRSVPGKWDKPERQVSATKKGPGRKAPASSDREAPRTAAAPRPLKKPIANVGRNPIDRSRRVWRAGEPVHIVKPVRATHAEAARNEARAAR